VKGQTELSEMHKQAYESVWHHFYYGFSICVHITNTISRENFKEKTDN
jgi:hypothetical protein